MAFRGMFDGFLRKNLRRHSLSSVTALAVRSMPTKLSSGGIAYGEVMPAIQNLHHWRYMSSPAMVSSTSQDVKETQAPTVALRDIYEKIYKSVDAKSTPPNAWLWSLIESCANKKDIDLLFQTLQNLRRFRLSALRINENFNSHLCQRVAEACARVGAFDYGLKALWKHNIYGLTPSIASAHYLLRHAKECNDHSLMERIMRILQKNGLPLQPGTADIVFSICYNANKWELISKYSRKFIKSGVKLHQSTFDIWMEFAVKRGDVASLWEIEKLRSNYTKNQTLSSTFSCAKGFLLEKKPENAAAVIHVLSQNLPEQKKSKFFKELQNLVLWPREAIKRQKGSQKEAHIALNKELSKMASILADKGIEMTLSSKGN
ncbi:hypothetical protein ZOSMA_154G00330 [Zostera marina]|uniref:Pentatricopeptide repeat-containing protein n=1 Tax=Zostera marina TaxID=29655 RepID=A0A0K9PXY8_ZOSMR|nr:hypothetical protein ZOSMA_154G00330 [Zostera marina]